MLLEEVKGCDTESEGSQKLSDFFKTSPSAADFRMATLGDTDIFISDLNHKGCFFMLDYDSLVHDLTHHEISNFTTIHIYV